MVPVYEATAYSPGGTGPPSNSPRVKRSSSKPEPWGS